MKEMVERKQEQVKVDGKLTAVFGIFLYFKN